MTKLYIIEPDWLGRTDFRTKTISIRERPKGLSFDKSEMQRLSSLGESCILITENLGVDRFGRKIEDMPNNYWHEINYSPICLIFGIVGGLEIYTSELCDGLKSAEVARGDSVFFKYEDYGESSKKYEGNSQILEYIPGTWEKTIQQWAETAKAKKSKKLHLPDNMKFL